MNKSTRIAAEKAADYEYHKFFDMGATIEDCINAAKEAYENIAGESMKDPLGFFGYDEETYEEIKDT
jgi:hypothetical protein